MVVGDVDKADGCHEEIGSLFVSLKACNFFDIL